MEIKHEACIGLLVGGGTWDIRKLYPLDVTVRCVSSPELCCLPNGTYEGTSRLNCVHHIKLVPG